MSVQLIRAIIQDVKRDVISRHTILHPRVKPQRVIEVRKAKHFTLLINCEVIQGEVFAASKLLGDLGIDPKMVNWCRVF